MFFSRNNLVQIFNGSIILCIVGMTIAIFGFYQIYVGEKAYGFYLVQVSLFPCIVSMCGLTLFIIKIKKINYKKDKS